MAKASMIARSKKVEKSINRYEKTRQQLKDKIKQTGDADALLALEKLPRNSSKSRLKRRCRVCGRPRSVYRKFGLCRLCLRPALMNGDVPGGTMASW